MFYVIPLERSCVHRLWCLDLFPYNQVCCVNYRWLIANSTNKAEDPSQCTISYYSKSTRTPPRNSNYLIYVDKRFATPSTEIIDDLMHINLNSLHRNLKLFRFLWSHALQLVVSHQRCSSGNHGGRRHYRVVSYQFHINQYYHLPFYLSVFVICMQQDCCLE